MYHERLWPTPTWFIAALLIIPAVILMLAPISLVLGIVMGIVVYLGIVALFLGKSPRVSFDGTELRAGRGHIERRFIGTATPIQGAELFAALHSELDARAWLCLRGWSRGVVKIEITDPDDPTPYWMVSSKHPERFAAAINASVAQPVAG